MKAHTHVEFRDKQCQEVWLSSSRSVGPALRIFITSPTGEDAGNLLLSPEQVDILVAGLQLWRRHLDEGYL